MWRYLWIAVLVLVFDQLTKFAATNFLTQHGEVNLAPFLNLVLVHNTGAAFGFLSSAGGWQNIFFIVVAVSVCVFILWMIWRMDSQDRLLAVGLMLVLGGALGNLTDRLIHGYVIDFIDVYYRTWHWPAFNVADSAITMGAVLLVVDALGSGRRHKH
ncbi:MAG: signal peptidase II [Candidatus Muproteobacteria bacterium RIFCSPHIGHO2_12_FULL_60_33]|uniref:Lipoprotein signal peptidase n=1 Tax=Candidatus Muproteobacteria bacterium RIFCSPLOWO2_01_FULL_60_18 TaxID=1817768 RepID=A0A1F6U673_9PROT|nr:MAG: signal peptidase II [Candidatus Muproteobacteria bacterium RIFCSPLOWO2_01_FULL_60_18]OGI53117.1 MAG: signal peptidase II [Candidatus Muproteobacteria bacterium RIFCSPHIGHO2_01_60_12]OGI53933.1 MAG: signal peptidase II [Candidatus Muproteobacteria bacterium RIFCSPHIGHO2_02_FULL_60_13]OGI54375.1 MAG: signal peptidase II [Candidatus Muproteobacteria bacterium RIFCSPHIGHO2_12_FULL_60_33]OGI59145.1 MAG: signal peptidase II [Candidatus Muproteobacteria bacterium RIFCSPHIGHO2_01_FULL_61_200]